LVHDASASRGDAPYADIFHALGGEGKIIEADETYIGGKEANKHASKRTVRGGTRGKEPVLSLVERGGKVRSYHLPEVTAATLKPILVAQVNHASFLMTDEARSYVEIGMTFAGHDRVSHGMGEYVRGEAHTNTIEGYFSILKRGIVGIDDGVDLGAQSSTRTANGVILAPFFPPPAC
jgi:hypothetical protein